MSSERNIINKLLEGNKFVRFELNGYYYYPSDAESCSTGYRKCKSIDRISKKGSVDILEDEYRSAQDEYIENKYKNEKKPYSSEDYLEDEYYEDLWGKLCYNKKLNKPSKSTKASVLIKKLKFNDLDDMKCYAITDDEGYYTNDNKNTKNYYDAVLFLNKKEAYKKARSINDYCKVSKVAVYKNGEIHVK